MLDARQIAMIQDSYVRLAPRSNELAAQFHESLFRRDPALRPLFDTDLRAQRRAMIDVLEEAVEGLGRFEALKEATLAFGERNRTRRLSSEHYASIGAALIEAMAALSGPTWTPELDRAWREAFGAVSGVLLAAGSRDLAAA